MSFKHPIPYPQCNHPLSIRAKVQSLPQVAENGKRNAVPGITLAHASSNWNPEAHSTSLQDAKIARSELAARRMRRGSMQWLLVPAAVIEDLKIR